MIVRNSNGRLLISSQMDVEYFLQRMPRELVHHKRQMDAGMPLRVRLVMLGELRQWSRVAQSKSAGKAAVKKVKHLLRHADPVMKVNRIDNGVTTHVRLFIDVDTTVGAADPEKMVAKFKVVLKRLQKKGFVPDADVPEEVTGADQSGMPRVPGSGTAKKGKTAITFVYTNDTKGFYRDVPKFLKEHAADMPEKASVKVSLDVEGRVRMAGRVESETEEWNALADAAEELLADADVMVDIERITTEQIVTLVIKQQKEYELLDYTGRAIVDDFRGSLYQARHYGFRPHLVAAAA